MIVVDDSEQTRRGISESVNWEMMDIEIVGEASDGLEAMVLIHDTDVDIIICDVRMPKLDGIALINEVLPSHPSLQVLFLSGYSDKEYLKNAIKLNAVDYLYKPLQLHELISAVEKAKKKCQSQKVHLPQREADLALSLLQYSETGAPPDLPLDLHAPMVSLILQMNAADEHIADHGYDSQLDDRLLASRHYLAFHKAAAQIFEGRFVMSCVGKGYILHANVSPDFLIRQTAELRLRPLLTTLDSVQADVVVGISNLCAGISHLREAYDEARAAVRAAFLLGYGRVIFFRDLSQKPFVPAPDLQREFYGTVLANDFTRATGFLNSYIDDIAACREQDIPQIKEALASIAFWLSQQMSKWNNQDSSPYISEFIHFAPDIDTVRRYLLAQLRRHIDNISNLDNKSRIVLEVEQYITQNYGKELSIREIAQHVFVTPNYLCYLYKKNTGRTLNQFILDTKMKKARRLVCETSMKFGEIADALGYANQNYFTRLFTKYFGESPRAYRNKHGSLSPHAPEEE